jgi:hypothetical protein
MSITGSPERRRGRKCTWTSSAHLVGGPRGGESEGDSSGSPRCVRIFRIGPGWRTGSPRRSEVAQCATARDGFALVPQAERRRCRAAAARPAAASPTRVSEPGSGTVATDRFDRLRNEPDDAWIVMVVSGLPVVVMPAKPSEPLVVLGTGIDLPELPVSGDASAAGGRGRRYRRRSGDRYGSAGGRAGQPPPLVASITA